MPTGPCDLLGTDDTPHRATSVWNDLGEFLQARASANNGKRMTALVFESNVIFHANHATA
jgi:hypothetical protein